MQSQILVPLDGSPLAEMIVPHARIWAQASGSRLTLLQVIRPPAVPDPLTGAVAPGAVPYATWKTRHEQARQYLHSVAATLAATEQAVDIAVREGEPATQIVAYAAGEPGVAGIAMATHGWGSLEGLLLGSQAEQVLHNAPTPLLLVRPQREGATELRLPPARPYRTIVVPLDGTPQAERALAPAQALAAARGARLLLVTAISEPAYTEPRIFARLSGSPPVEDIPPDPYLARMAAQYGTSGVPVATALVVGSPVEAIVHACADADADLLVMATHGPRGVDRLWHASVAAQVLQRAAYPIMLIRT